MLRTARSCNSLEPGVRSRSRASSRSAIWAALALRRSTSTPTTPSGRRLYRRSTNRDNRWEGAAAGGGVSHVDELERDAEVRLAHRPNHGLEVVLLLAGDAHLIALDVALDLHAGPLDELHELLGLVLGDPDVHVHALPIRALGGRQDRALREGLQRDLSADGLVLHDVEGGLQAIFGRAPELDELVVATDRRA